MRSIKYLSGFLLVIALFVIASSCSYKKKITATNIKLDSHFSSNMVFKKGDTITITGTCDPGGILALEIQDGFKLIYADASGRWIAKVPPIDYKGPFTISVEGLKQNIKLENVVMGKVWVVIGDTWLNDTPEHVFEKSNHIYRGSNDKVRIYTPKSLFSVDEDDNSEWRALDTRKKEYRELFAGLLGDELSGYDDDPVGIINLAWPGTSLSNFTNSSTQNVTGNLSAEKQDSLWLDYFSNQKRYNFLADSSFKGIERDVLDRFYDDWDWSDISFPIITQKRWFLKDRIIWLRKKVFIANKYITSDFFVDFGPIRGHYDFYFNGRHLEKFEGESTNYQLQIPDSIVETWANLITVRMVTGDSLSGFYAETPKVVNADSTYRMEIAEDWTIRTYYEPKLPEISRPEQLVPQIAQKYLSSLKGVSVNTVLLAGSVNQYVGLTNESLSSVLSFIESNIKSEKNYFYLLPVPGYFDSKYNSELFNSIRNAQLEASIKQDWNIINAIDIKDESLSGLQRKMVKRLMDQIEK